MDPEILRLSERLSIAIELGESHFREFKSALEGPPSGKKARDPKDVCEDISKTLVAFANADGGELVIGVEDDRQVTGLPYKAEILELLKNAPKTHVHKDTPLPRPHVVVSDLSGQQVLYFSVPKGFVEFDESADAAKAIADSGAIAVDGRQLVVRAAEPKAKSAGAAFAPVSPRRPRGPEKLR